MRSMRLSRRRLAGTLAASPLRSARPKKRRVALAVSLCLCGTVYFATAPVQERVPAIGRPTSMAQPTTHARPRRRDHDVECRDARAGMALRRTQRRRIAGPAALCQSYGRRRLRLHRREQWRVLQAERDDRRHRSARSIGYNTALTCSTHGFVSTATVARTPAERINSLSTSPPPTATSRAEGE